MIHTMHENEFDVDDEQFLRDTGFVIECVKGLIYRELGVDHPMSSFMEHITRDVDTSKEGGVYFSGSMTDLAVKQNVQDMPKPKPQKENLDEDIPY